MKALRFDSELRLVNDTPLPGREGEALVQVICAGICNTDLEITKGYAGFHGTPGHEFVGRVVESPGAALVGRRVVGEINVGCDRCAQCQSGDQRHCAARTVLGIKGRDGAFAEFLSLPARNLVEVPDSLSDEEAVFVEPLAAACQVLEQVEISERTSVAIVGDGKLAQLITRALAQTGCSLLVIGKHKQKLGLAESAGAKVFQLGSPQIASAEPAGTIAAYGLDEKFDVVVETSGSATGFPLALALVKPRGALVLKSTHHKPTPVDMSQVVVNEIRVIGSRCGRFSRALGLLSAGAVNVLPLVTDRMALEDGLSAFQVAADPESLKVILRMPVS